MKFYSILFFAILVFSFADLNAAGSGYIEDWPTDTIPTAGLQHTTRRTQFAVETRATTWLQGGYDIGFFILPAGSRFSFGALFAGHNVNGSTKSLLFEGEGLDDLDMRLTWILSLQARYHFSAQRKGFFLETGIGAEAFRVSDDKQSLTDPNAFIAPGIGFTWLPIRKAGLFVIPKVSAVFTAFRPEEQYIGETNFRLKPFFPTPAISVGWKF